LLVYFIEEGLLVMVLKGLGDEEVDVVLLLICEVLVVESKSFIFYRNLSMPFMLCSKIPVRLPPPFFTSLVVVALVPT
jgi:hypothetical protein